MQVIGQAYTRPVAMTKDRLHLITVVLLALPVVGIHIAYKQHPSAEEIAATSRFLARPAQWQGKTAPDFELETLEGELFRLSDHVGREVVVLNFFATWCAPCRIEMPELNRMVAQNGEEPFAILGIDAAEQADLVSAFVAEVPVSFPVAIDEKGYVAKAFGVASFPTTVVIGADGRIALYQTGRISNVDVAFAPFLGANLQAIRAGQGISRDTYLDAAARESYPLNPASPARDDVALGERARRIAEAMDCPCGCEHKVASCSCSTADKIKERLASDSLEDRSDADVIRELNREFCMEEMD